MISIMNTTKRTFKPCSKCGLKPQDISEVTFGEFNETGNKWYCFEHVECLWNSVNQNIKNQSDWWDYLEKINGKCPRPN